MVPADQQRPHAQADPNPDAASADAQLKAEKKRLRQAAMRQRARAAEQAGVAAGRQLRDHLLPDLELPNGAAVSAYWPMGDEIDPIPAIEALHGRGHPIGLPAMPGKAQPLQFRAWHPGSALEEGGFGTQVPPADAGEVTPSVLLVPLLAFDRAGYRLGYGGGFYDRTLAKLRAADPATRAVGVAYLGQEIETVPHDSFDQPLDAVVTEQGPVALVRGGPR